MASRAVSLSWWSYRKSLSKKSKASGETRCWFSLCTKRSHRLRECLGLIQHRLGIGNYQQTTVETVFTCRGYRWTVDPVQFDICQDIQKVPLCLALWRCERADRSCRARGKRAPYGRSSRPTCSQETTCPGNSHTSDNLPATQDLFVAQRKQNTNTVSNKVYHPIKEKKGNYKTAIGIFIF